MYTRNPINQQMNQTMFELYNACSEIKSDTKEKVEKILNDAIKISKYQDPEYANAIRYKLKNFKSELICKMDIIELQKKGDLESIIKSIKDYKNKFKTIVGLVKKEHEIKRKREEESNETESNKRRKINHPQNEIKNHATATGETKEDAERRAADEQGDADMELAKMLMECDDEGLNNQFDTDLVLAKRLARKEQEDADMQFALQIQEAETQSERERRMPAATNNLDMAIKGALAEMASCPTVSLEESLMDTKQITSNNRQFFV